MPDPASDPVASLVSNLESTIVSDIAGVAAAPVIGWIDSMLGIDADTPNISTVLGALQQDTNAILGAISGLQDTIKKWFNDSEIETLQGDLDPATGAVKGYNDGKTPLQVPDKAIDSCGPFPNQMHGYLTTETTGDPDAGTLSTGLLQHVISNVLPRFQSPGVTVQIGKDANGSPIVQPAFTVLQNFLDHYVNVQAILLQMLIEAAHQGQPVYTDPAITPPGSVPPNYSEAVKQKLAYSRHIAIQQSYIPFPNSYQGVLPGLGCENIVLDTTAPASAP